ncbi:hypothetical protein [Tenacibaculum jejuense]|uniref:Uncharacterized protein n=1 Tax=Tenacibaculum jejuense TaxID=584609 RepID=A0A238UEP9_9FLAO|nr:hypothetical protein [Tenacibaculum jejuense]SNR17631.1 conserved membrane protein of unknown function [Tenacibaculum jejuense]
MKKIVYAFLIITTLFLSVLRIDMETNLDRYGLVHREVPNESGFNVSMFPTGILEGYSGSMTIFVLLIINLMVLLFINYKYDSNNKKKGFFFLLLFGFSMMIFEETLIRSLGLIIISILIYKYVLDLR